MEECDKAGIVSKLIYGILIVGLWCPMENEFNFSTCLKFFIIKCWKEMNSSAQHQILYFYRLGRGTESQAQAEWEFCKCPRFPEVTTRTATLGWGMFLTQLQKEIEFGLSHSGLKHVFKNMSNQPQSLTQWGQIGDKGLRRERGAPQARTHPPGQEPDKEPTVLILLLEDPLTIFLIHLSPTNPQIQNSKASPLLNLTTWWNRMWNKSKIKKWKLPYTFKYYWTSTHGKCL